MKKLLTAKIACLMAAVLIAAAGIVSSHSYAMPEAENPLSEPAVEHHGHGHHGDPGDHGKGMLGFDVLQTAADAIGMKPDALRSELESGKSLAQIAEARGMKKDELVNKLNGAVSKRLDERVAAGDMTKDRAAAIRTKVSEHMAAAVESNRLGQYLNQGRHHAHGIGRYASPDELAKLLGMTPNALHAELKSGKSLAEIAAAKGISEEQLIAKLKDNMTDDLQKFVRAKRQAAKP